MMQLNAKLNDPNVKKRIKSIMSESSAALTRIEDERVFLKDTVSDLSDEFDIPKKIIKKMIKAYHKQSFNEESEEQEQFLDIYQTVMLSNVTTG